MSETNIARHSLCWHLGAITRKVPHAVYAVVILGIAGFVVLVPVVLVAFLLFIMGRFAVEGVRSGEVWVIAVVALLLVWWAVAAVLWALSLRHPKPDFWAFLTDQDTPSDSSR